MPTRAAAAMRAHIDAVMAELVAFAGSSRELFADGDDPLDPRFRETIEPASALRTLSAKLPSTAAAAPLSRRTLDREDTMKLMRVGAKGAEKPALLAEDGTSASSASSPTSRAKR